MNRVLEQWTIAVRWTRSQARSAASHKGLRATVAFCRAAQTELPKTASTCTHCVRVAAANLVQNRVRFLVAVSGAAMPIILLFLQMALLQAVGSQVNRLYSFFDFDLAIVPATYEYLYSGSTFDTSIMSEAAAMHGVADTFILNVASAAWSTDQNAHSSPIILIGIDDDPAFITDSNLARGAGELQESNAVLLDAYSSPEIGQMAGRATGMVNGRAVSVVGHFGLGLFFYADGAVVLKNPSFPEFAERSSHEASIGLLRLRPGSDVAAVTSELQEALPPEVRVLRRSELVDNEKAFFLTNKPIGLYVRVGMLIAVLSGIVILWEVLSTEISRRISEFATLAAIGFHPAFFFGVGICESFLLGFAAFVPAFAISAIVLAMIELTTSLPSHVTMGLSLEILLIVAVMCGICSLSVVRRIARADPADLY